MQKCFQQICLKLVLRKSFRRKHKKMLTRFQVNIPGNKTTTSPNTLKNEARVPGQSAPSYLKPALWQKALDVFSSHMGSVKGSLVPASWRRGRRRS